MFGHRAFRCFSKSFCKNTKDVILTQWTCDCKSHFYRNQRFISIVSKWGGNGLLSLIDFVKLGVATCLKFQKPKRIWVCWFKHLSSMKWAKTCRDRFSNAIIRKQPAQWTQTQHIISTHHIIISHHLPSFLLSIISIIEFSDPKKGLQGFFGFFGFFGLGSSKAEELDFSSLPRVDEARCPDAQSNSLLQWKFKKKKQWIRKHRVFFWKIFGKASKLHSVLHTVYKLSSCLAQQCVQCLQTQPDSLLRWLCSLQFWRPALRCPVFQFVCFAIWLMFCFCLCRFFQVPRISHKREVAAPFENGAMAKQVKRAHTDAHRWIDWNAGLSNEV